MREISISFNPTKLQGDILKAFQSNDYTFICAKLGRRSGKSFLGTYMLLRYSLENPGKRSLLVTPTYKLCGELFNLLKDKIAKLPFVESINSSDFFITFTNGSRIDFISSVKPDNARGQTFTGICIIDEGAFISDYMIESIVLPAFATAESPRFIYLSTPNFKRGSFYNTYNDGLNGVNSTISFSGPSSSSPYVNEFFLRTMKAKLKEKDYKREILAEFLDDSDGVFKYNGSKIEEIRDYKKCYFGVDVGKGDKSSVAIISDKCEIIHLEEFGGTDYTVIMDKMVKIVKDFNCDYGFIESNGVGSAYLDFFKKEISRVEGWNSSNTSKNKMIEDQALYLEKGNLKILDKFYDLLAYQYDNVTSEYNTETRKLRYLFGRDGTGHCDSVVSVGLALQCFLSKTKKGVYSIC